MSSVTDDDQTLAKLEPFARAIDKAIDSLHDAMHKAKQQGCDLQILIVAIDDLPVPPCASSATEKRYGAAPNTWSEVVCFSQGKSGKAGSAGPDQRAHLVNVLCMTFDEAFSAGREGEIDPVCVAAAMNGYVLRTGFLPSNF